MEISQKLLALALLYSAVVGTVLGVLYDIFRIIRVAMKPSPGMSPKLRSFYDAVGDTVIFIEDILFAFIAALVVAVFLFHVNDGQLRWFVLAGAAVGFFLYYMTVGRLVLLCAGAIISFVKAVLGFLLRITIIPLIKLLRIFRRFAVKFALRTERKIYTAVMMKRALRHAQRGFK